MAAAPSTVAEVDAALAAVIERRAWALDATEHARLTERIDELLELRLHPQPPKAQAY